MGGMGVVGGPVGAPPTTNNGLPPNQQPHGGNGTDSNSMNIKKLNTYIYDYFLKNNHHDLARAVATDLPIETVPNPKLSPNQRNVNGSDDAMDPELKEGQHKRPDDLPIPNVPRGSDSAFLLDWWCQFWDCFNAHRKNGKPNQNTNAYLQFVKNQTQERNRQQMMLQGMDPAAQRNYRNMNLAMQNGMGMPNDLKKAAMQNNRNATPQQQQQTLNQMRYMQNLSNSQMQQVQQQQMLNHSAQMKREGSQMEMQQRPQSPGGSVDNAPSPKRQRLDGNPNFNGQQMGPAGRGQPQGMQGQQ
ncbi:hypothetical protein LTR66_003530, partial [Elasticomyces elasticus]